MQLKLPRKALVTGAAGFLGSHLCKRLLDDGYEVTALDNLFTGTKRNIEELMGNRRFSFVLHDVTQSFWGQFDEIYNLACPASPIHYQHNPVETTKSSVLGMMNMLELALKTKAKVLHTSTSEIYGDPLVHPQVESYWGNVNTIGIRSCYDEGKRCAETLAADYRSTLGTGVGGGIIVEGKLLCGAHGAGGEIGHMTLHREETLRCNCGKYGCVEQYCSATGVVRTAQRYLQSHDAPSSLRALEKLTCKDVFDAAAAGDAAANEILDIVYQNMAEFLGNLCVTVDPDVVVIGGGVSKAGKPLLDGIRKYLPQYQIHTTRNVELSLATLGNDAGAYGACKLVLDAGK